MVEFLKNLSLKNAEEKTIFFEYFPSPLFFLFISHCYKEFVLVRTYTISLRQFNTQLSRSYLFASYRVTLSTNSSGVATLEALTLSLPAFLRCYSMLASLLNSVRDFDERIPRPRTADENTLLQVSERHN